MKIAYRRMSGAIGVSPNETGTRGLWFEKRLALVLKLINRGHSVDFVSRMTKPSSHVESHDLRSDHDVLMIEFGSANTRFYGKDLEETQALAQKHMGQIIFICDDPDLPYLWQTVKNPSQWSCWYNAVKPPHLGGQPFGVKSYDLPFSSLQAYSLPKSSYQNEKLVYIGRPGGRGETIRNLLVDQAPWRVFGKQAEWDAWGVMVRPAPDQPKRKEFYADQIGCLALADSKHKTTGWRTGRAYHAMLAGCPSLIEADHVCLNGFPKFSSIDEVKKTFHRWRDSNLRLEDWQRQISYNQADIHIAEETLKAHGL